MSRVAQLLIGSVAALVACGVTGASHAADDPPSRAPTHPLLAELRARYLKAQQRMGAVEFRARLAVENSGVKETKTVTYVTPTGTASVTAFDKQEHVYRYSLDGRNVRRDWIEGAGRPETVVHRNGKTLQYLPVSGRAWIRPAVDFEGSPVDPRCFGLRPGADNLASYLEQLRTKPGEASAEGRQAVVVARDPKGFEVRLTLDKERDYLPVRIEYRTAEGQLESVTWLEYDKHPATGTWYLSKGRNYLFGTRQPKAVDESLDAERAWASKMTFTLLGKPELIPADKIEARFGVSLPVGTAVQDSTRGGGVRLYRLSEQGAGVPFDLLDPARHAEPPKR